MSASASASKTSDVESVDLGIEKDRIAQIVGGLRQALADTYLLYMKTLGVHWNVVGPSFYGLHKLTEEQYEDLHSAADEIAERIRALGHLAPASYSEFREMSDIDAETPHGDTTAMLQQLIADNEAAARSFRRISDVAEAAEDKYTEDMLIARIGQHEENAWMLRASAHS